MLICLISLLFANYRISRFPKKRNICRCCLNPFPQLLQTNGNLGGIYTRNIPMWFIHLFCTRAHLLTHLIVSFHLTRDGFTHPPTRIKFSAKSVKKIIWYTSLFVSSDLASMHIGEVPASLSMDIAIILMTKKFESTLACFLN